MYIDISMGTHPGFLDVCITRFPNCLWIFGITSEMSGWRNNIRSNEPPMFLPSALHAGCASARIDNVRAYEVYTDESTTLLLFAQRVSPLHF